LLSNKSCNHTIYNTSPEDKVHIQGSDQPQLSAKVSRLGREVSRLEKELVDYSKGSSRLIGLRLGELRSRRKVSRLGHLG